MCDFVEYRMHINARNNFQFLRRNIFILCSIQLIKSFKSSSKELTRNVPCDSSTIILGSQPYAFKRLLWEFPRRILHELLSYFSRVFFSNSFTSFHWVLLEYPRKIIPGFSSYNSTDFFWCFFRFLILPEEYLPIPQKVLAQCHHR